MEIIEGWLDRDISEESDASTSEQVIAFSAGSIATDLVPIPVIDSSILGSTRLGASVPAPAINIATDSEYQCTSSSLPVIESSTRSGPPDPLNLPSFERFNNLAY